ncbi:MAG: N-acetylneuraminate synthase [Elusimicrobia bacterium]|nr:N-acetylneuraminate synthase [Elusimicrobiota bacterium]
MPAANPTSDRVFVIAEAGVNHNGDLALAERLVDAAKAAGADAVKFQTFRADSLATDAAALAPYQAAAGVRDGQRTMLAKLELDEAAHRRLQARARATGIEFLSTPFDEASADLLERLGMPLFKLPSGEVTNKRLVEHVARKGWPMILSTGMCDLDEVRRAVGWIRAVSSAPLTVLHCVTEYPAPADQVNLRAMDALRDALGLPVGYSDHTLGTEVSVAAAARGAAVIEKHITLDRTLPGPDHAASLEPAAFSEMVRQIRAVTSALGDGIKRAAPCEEKNKRIVRRGLAAARALKRGSTLAACDIAILRPEEGLPAFEADAIVGRRLKIDLAKGVAISRAALE